MRVAVVSDIHGNLMALDAVMTDLEKQAPDQVWCAGDLGWGGPWATECIERVRAAGWITVKGNTDVWITGDPQTIDDRAQRERLEAIAAQHAISASDADWLINLPFGHKAAGGVLMVHGTPDSQFDAPGPDAPANEFAPYEGKGIVIYGHVHYAFVRRLADATIVCNPGSVGMPQDAETASYLLMDLQGGDAAFRHVRVSYDRRAAIAQAQRMGGPLGELFLANVQA